MKLKFKVQPYQTAAVESVVDCFNGQGFDQGLSYRIDPGKNLNIEYSGFRNSDLKIHPETILQNVRQVQARHNLERSESLIKTKDCALNLDIEMETGTGKTYCYIKTIFELNRCYGWNKFIIVVPSIAIREGVLKSLEITAEHFNQTYLKKARFFCYNSRQLHHLESFSSDAGINVMVINIQAFNAAGKDNRRIYEELDDFQSRKPIDVISSNRPILILDEPQKMEGKKTLEALAKFRPLFTLRYSATHKTSYNKIHRLDALDAYNQKLVKKIAVRGIEVKNLTGANAYLFLESIEISRSAPVARLELEVRQASGIKRIVKRLGVGTDLFAESNEMDQYRGFVISEIDYRKDSIEFTNGVSLQSGNAVGDVTEQTVRRIQIREAIKAHLDKEKQLYNQGIKILTLFFIDEVAKYRDYSQADEQGEYARVFEEEYEILKNEYLRELELDNPKYRKHLQSIKVGATHNGYFSIDKKTKRLTDPGFKTRGEDAGLSDDVDAYDLILKDKERLLSFEEPVRFIFSHSALREGWDNPNVFVMCMLKNSDNTISRRQEVGRGLRISVNQHGERMDNPGTVHEINVLTVVASESYKNFVTNLQSEISESLSQRPRKADSDYFCGKIIKTENGDISISADQADAIEFYLIQNAYVDKKRHIVENYHKDKENGALAVLPEELLAYEEQVFALIDSVYSDKKLPVIGDDRKPKTNPLNDNFDKKEFKQLWERINKKAIYSVDFDSDELIKKCINTLNTKLHVAEPVVIVEHGIQHDQVEMDAMARGDAFVQENLDPHYNEVPIASSSVKYDLLGKLSENTQLTRKTVAKILQGVESGIFEKFRINPEHFITECSRLINEQKATIIVQRISYDTIDETYDIDIFTASQSKQDFSKAGDKLKKHIYDYVVTDSNIERTFAEKLDIFDQVEVYAKLPKGFSIPTPVGDYNPDWAIAFKEGEIKHVFFVAETKGTLATLELRAVEQSKISCARKFFDKINDKINENKVKYDVVDKFERLMTIIR